MQKQESGAATEQIKLIPRCSYTQFESQSIKQDSSKSDLVTWVQFDKLNLKTEKWDLKYFLLGSIERF